MGTTGAGGTDRPDGDDHSSGLGKAFVFDRPLDFATPVDHIASFSPDKDTIVLDHDVFGSIGEGDWKAKYFNDGTSRVDGNDHIIYICRADYLLRPGWSRR